MAQRLKVLPASGDIVRESESRDASPAVAAHPSPASIGIVVPHRKFGNLAFFQNKQPITADPEMPVAHGTRKSRKIDAEIPAHVVHDDEVIPCARRFRKINRESHCSVLKQCSNPPSVQSDLYSVVLPSKCSLSASASARVW
jgi:hypothetical protein